MRRIFTLLILFFVTDSMGQSQLNKNTRLTKTEFSELKKEKDEFVPSDLRTDTVIIVKYSAVRLAQLQRIARNEEFARNGEDTTGYTDEKFFGKKQAEQAMRIYEKFSKDYPVEQEKALRAKGVRTLIVDESVLQSKNYLTKYWLTTVYLCTQKGFHAAWYTSVTSRFYDPRAEKKYELLLVSNYELIDLVE